MRRVDFAKHANVDPSAVTQACRKSLGLACVGDSIDVNHPAAIEYIQYGRGRSTHIDVVTGLDKLFPSVCEWCRLNQVWEALPIQHAFHIGKPRATEMLAIMKASGEIPFQPSGLPVPDALIAPVDPSLGVVPASSVAGGNGAGMGMPAGVPMPPGREFIASGVESIEIPEDIQNVADMSLREVIHLYGTNSRFIEWLKAIQAIEVIEEKRLKNAQTEGKLVSRELIATNVISPIDATIRMILTDGVKTIVQRLIAMHDAGEDQKALEELVGDQLSSFFRPMKIKIVRGLDNA